MKRSISLFFLALVAINVFGHFFILKLVETRLSFKTQELIESHASEINGNLILTIPLASFSAPFRGNSDGYELVSGEISFDGVSFRKVKQKVQGDLLYVVCIKDNTTNLAKEEANELVSAASGQPLDPASPGVVKVLTALLQCYLPADLSSSTTNNRWCVKFDTAGPPNRYWFTALGRIFRPPSLISIAFNRA